MTPGTDAETVDTRSQVITYPGGKSGAGIFQRLITMIPRHRVLISAFAGQCGITRRIKPAEHTIVIDTDWKVCQWWDEWQRSPKGRRVEIHHCDSIEWLRFRYGITEFGQRTVAHLGGTADEFIFADPPYVLGERSHGKQYDCELTDGDHGRLLEILTQIPTATASVMLCGYRSPLYASVDEIWRTFDHRVPTRGGLQDERLWMNYPEPSELQDYRYLGGDRRGRERIRRRQRNWMSQLNAMSDPERAAMLEHLNGESNG